MRFYDIFNGDADGICALHQLRLAEPRDAELVTGVKRDIELLARVEPRRGDEVTVLDVSLETNRAHLLRMLEDGVRCRYFDHHFAGAVPNHRLLDAHIDTAPSVCTSLIVDRFLRGKYRAWAVVAAFGDGLPKSALAAAGDMHFSAHDLGVLRELGECLNYNAYGDSVEDLHFHPAELYRRLRHFADPLVFAARAPEFDLLRRACAGDLEQARKLPVLQRGQGCIAVFMADEAWCRRVSGVFANALAGEHPQQAIAILVARADGYRVSLRAPRGIQNLARQFESGSGRERAAGIQLLPEQDVERLLELLERTYAVKNPGTGV
ncbi:MAG: DHHA1 domain-containing protein [Betaproteobacteria bacterium]